MENHTPSCPVVWVPHPQLSWEKLIQSIVKKLKQCRKPAIIPTIQLIIVNIYTRIVNDFLNVIFHLTWTMTLTWIGVNDWPAESCCDTLYLRQTQTHQTSSSPQAQPPVVQPPFSYSKRNKKWTKVEGQKGVGPCDAHCRRRHHSCTPTTYGRQPAFSVTFTGFISNCHPQVVVYPWGYCSNAATSEETISVSWPSWCHPPSGMGHFWKETPSHLWRCRKQTTIQVWEQTFIEVWEQKSIEAREHTSMHINHQPNT